MKKYIEKIKKYNIDVIILIILMTSLLSFLIYLNSGDELWNFANCYKMFNGYKIYKELNVIITPLFFYIAQIFFKLFGATMFTFRIYNIIIFLTFFMLIYYIFRELKIVRRRSIFYILLLLIFIFGGVIANGANYNILVLIPILINILLILKEKENDYITGLLLFITFMTKQNVFVFFSIGILVYKFLTKKKFKQFVISLIKTYSIAIIGIGLFLLYMYLDNNLYYFIDYCFLGIKEFRTNNTFLDVIESRYTWISLGITVFLLFIINNKKTNKNIEKKVTKNSKMLLCFAIPLLITQYPIANYYHSVIANLLIIISFIYIIEKTLIQELEINRKKEKIFYVVLIIAYLLYFIFLIINAKIETNKRYNCIKYTRTILWNNCTKK